MSILASRAETSPPPADAVMPSPIVWRESDPSGLGPAPGDLLQREPQRLGVGELAVEQRQRGLQRGALGVGERDRRQVEGLGRERVVLLLGEAVGRLVDREVDSQRVELRPVRIETPRERVLGHVRVALDVAPDLRGRDGTPLRHQIGDQRQLADELFGVLRQTLRHLRVRREPYSSAAAEIPRFSRSRSGRPTHPHASSPCADRGSPGPPGGSRAAARARGHRSAGHRRRRASEGRELVETPRAGRRADRHPARRGLRHRADRAADRRRPRAADRPLHGLQRDRAADQRPGLRRARLRAQGRHAERAARPRSRPSPRAAPTSTRACTRRCSRAGRRRPSGCSPSASARSWTCSPRA